MATIGRGSPVVGLRADMDALPIQEVADVSFRHVPSALHAQGNVLTGQPSLVMCVPADRFQRVLQRLLQVCTYLRDSLVRQGIFVCGPCCLWRCTGPSQI